MFDLVPFRKKNEEVFRSFMKSFNDVFIEDFFTPMRSYTHHFHTDIREREDAYFIESELPGFTKEDIVINYSHNYLTIKAKRNEEKNMDDNNGNQVIRRERFYGEFVRRFYVENIEDEKISASFQNGILKLEIPKRAKAESNVKRIEIK